MAANAPPMTATDSLSQAVKANIIHNQEYLLQGSVLDSAVEVLLHRLRGLCDNVDAGPETFDDQEVCFILRDPNQQALPSMLRVRKALDARDMPYQLRYIGQADGEKNRPTVLRSVLDIACSGMLFEFLNELGCRIEYEYSVKGYMFRKGRMKITVAKVFKIPQSSMAPEPISQSYLVELSVLAPTGQDAIGEDMRAFADQLRPLVQLDKIDYKRLSHMAGA
ncbi:mediator of RNA polymerase II transcription subunit 18 [Maniola hyperantus]|uniref:mediator of RNA polymerase II transcription subunit 18 n=1 Tax=Aphantopus hyperantus TaxID=2795564 RepID=UPI0015696ECC|nr:mediator of RNA polymerase II transcription subunit 18 [Maniola hyperantus]